MKPSRKPRTTCLTCKDRKLKCSGERPQCRTCINFGRRCRGYGPLVVVGQPPDGPAQREAGDPAGRTSLFAPVPARHAMREQLLSLYLQQQLPDEITAARAHQNRNWLLQIPELEDLAPSFDAAILATCACRLGHHVDDALMRYRSLGFYDRSLRELRRAIANPALRHQDQTLATCLALTMFEFTVNPERRVGGYLTHYSGCMELLRHRGPETHAVGLAHSVFKALRIHTVFGSFEKCSVSFLGQKDWMELPFAVKGKDSFDQLIDIMLRLPKILVNPGGAHKGPMSQGTLADTVQLARAAWRFDSELTDWIERFSAETSGPLYWPEPSIKFAVPKSAESAENELFPDAYDFPNFAMAQAMVFYWLSRVLVYYRLGLAYEKLQDFSDVQNTPQYADAECICPKNKKSGLAPCLLHFSFKRLTPIGYRGNWSKASARHICQSVGYFLQGKMRIAGPACLFSPLMIVRWHWQAEYSGEDRSAEIQWINAAIVRVYQQGSRIAGLV